MTCAVSPLCTSRPSHCCPFLVHHVACTKLAFLSRKATDMTPAPRAALNVLPAGQAAVAQVEQQGAGAGTAGRAPAGSCTL